MSFAAKFAKQSEKNGSMLDTVIRENALVYALWINGEAGVRHFLIIHVEKAKHTRFAELLEKKEPSDEEKAIFREKYGLFTEDA